MKRLALIALLVCGVLTVPTALAATPNPKTVAQFHRLPKTQRRQFAIEYMTTHGVDPCDQGESPLSREEARNIAYVIVNEVRPGPDAADGSFIKGSTPIGEGIRHILGNVGC